MKPTDARHIEVALERARAQLPVLAALVREAGEREAKLKADPKAKPAMLVTARQAVLAAEETLAQHEQDITLHERRLMEARGHEEREKKLAEMVELAKEAQAAAAELREVLTEMQAALATLGPKARAVLERLSRKRQAFKQRGAELVPGFAYLALPLAWSEERISRTEQAITALVQDLEARGAELSVVRSPVTESDRSSVSDLPRPVPVFAIQDRYGALAWQAMLAPSGEER